MTLAKCPIGEKSPRNIKSQKKGMKICINSYNNKQSKQKT